MTGVSAHVTRLWKRREGEPDMPTGGTMGSRAALGLTGKALEALTLVALVIFLPRLLGSADFGAFALALSIVLLATSSVALGGPTLASRFLAAAPAHERTALARGLVVRSAKWRLGAVVGGGLVALFVVAARPELLPAAAVALVLIAVVLDVAATLVLQVGLALGAVGPWTFRYPLQNAALVIGALSLYPPLGRTGALLAIPVASGASLVLALASTLPRLRGVPTARRLPQRLGRFALIQGAAGFLVQGVHRGGAIAVALLAGSDAEIGFAALAAGIATAATYVVWQVYALELPRVAGHELAAAHSATMRLTRRALGLAVPVALVGVLLCPTVVPALLGREYEDAVPAIALALAIVPLAPGAAALNQVAALRMSPGSRLAAVSLGFAAFAVAVLLGVSEHGAVGAAAALVVGSAVTVAAAAVPARRMLDPGLTALSLVATAVIGGIALLQ